MKRRLMRNTCCSVLAASSVIGLAWAQGSLADIEFLEFLNDWSEEEQQWLDAELDAITDSDCNTNAAGSESVNTASDICTTTQNEQEDTQ